MRYINELGFIGNIKRLFKSVSETNSVICNNHAELKASIEEAEIFITEKDLESIDTEQAITDLDFRLMELEGDE